MDYRQSPGFEWHEELDSTNSRAHELARLPDTPATVLIVADRQTAGRGRGANTWWSAEGSLTFSLLIDASEEQLPSVHWPLVSLLAAQVIGDAIAAFLPGHDVRVKWPNDVYLQGKKVCGILVEVPPVRPARLIVGIGINVNNSLLEAPEEVRARATSLADEGSQAFDREAVLEAVVTPFLAKLDRLRESDLGFLERWPQRCLLTGKQVQVDCTTRIVEGRCEGIDHAGALLLRTPSGQERLFAGVVKHWE